MDKEKPMTSTEGNPASDNPWEQMAQEVVQEQVDKNYWLRRREEALGKIKQLEMSPEELDRIGDYWHLVKVDEAELAKAREQSANPNSFAPGVIVAGGNLPMQEESIYRHVKSPAVGDLMNVGFVRNKRAAADALDIPGKAGFGTSGATVYWNVGVAGKDERVSLDGDIIIEASKSAAGEDYVQAKDIRAIWVADEETGQPKNLIG